MSSLISFTWEGSVLVISMEWDLRELSFGVIENELETMADPSLSGKVVA